MLLIAVGAYAAIVLTLWLTYGNLGSDHIPYLSGRYLLPIYFTLGWCSAGLMRGFLQKLRARLFWIGIVANLAWLGVILVSIGKRTLQAG